ncbi:YchJ family metal-binding protein [Kitasatospora sp. NBC_01287]|uniref:YchJ family protein n=1 Tax=Kitasatospora sp. NBC_01287 TaxID=2903573 RepID=UPI002251E3E2|nr:YchJ family metal-binding protein [Kitasatospora sp. NBC_01287]MCX4744850.1 YchJ family metal-binding protein [Kitasatospora sp. NBC_01287]
MSRRATRPRPTQRPAEPTACPCGLPASYADCCGRLHRGLAPAVTAEQLMRSRFSAFALEDTAYLLRSWHPLTRPAEVDYAPELRWQRLEILGSTEGGPFHQEGTVEFTAHYRERGHAGAMHENSRFVRHEGAWVYLDGDVAADSDPVDRR